MINVHFPNSYFLMVKCALIDVIAVQVYHGYVLWFPTDA